MAAGKNKQFLLLGERTVLELTAAVFAAYEKIDGIIVVAKQEEMDSVKTLLASTPKLIDVVCGGKERQDSVYHGLQALPKECEYVWIHDGARPLVSKDVLERIAETVHQKGAAVAGVALKDTIKQADREAKVERTIPRQSLWSVQTPQAFRKEIVQQAYEAAFQEGYYGTDDASLVEKLGIDVYMVEGSYENIKLTTPEDIFLAENILRKRKEG